jgi:hypothetical protein
MAVFLGRPYCEKGSSNDIGEWKNASGQEVFGTKAPQTPVVESPTVSAADVTSAATGVGTVVAPEADKARTTLPPATVSRHLC